MELKAKRKEQQMKNPENLSMSEWLEALEARISRIERFLAKEGKSKLVTG